MKNTQKEKIMRIQLKKQSILIVLVGITIILTFINLYWTANLAKQIIPLTDEFASELREV